MLTKTEIAIDNGRSMYQKNVFSTYTHKGAVVKPSGNTKLGRGAIVQKGRHEGKKIYTVTLEERKTCPSSCFHWKTCYGNSTPFGHRFKHGAGLEKKIARELTQILRNNKKGILLRLHVLGDFYSVDYVKFWETKLREFNNLAIWGYTAWKPTTPIGRAIEKLRKKNWDNFSVRFSNLNRFNLVANSEDMLNQEGLICPEQEDKTESCATCGLCWNSNLDKILFKTH